MQREPFDAPEFERLPAGIPWISAVYAHLEIGSTNREAARLAAEGAPEGTVVVADTQTAGRGRLGRSWVAEPGTSLLASWVVRPPIPADKRSLLTLATAVSAARAIQDRCRLALSLKWPNDLISREMKLGGILAEALPGGAVVIGVGINVRQDGFDVAIEQSATSLLLEGARPISRARLLGSILSAFSPFAHAPEASLEEYRRRCGTIGRKVRVERPGAEPLVGVASAVAEDGSLVVAGEIVAAGDVIHLRSARPDE